MLVLGWIAMFAGALLFFASLFITLRANPDTTVPYNRNPLVIPRYSIAMRSVGAALLIIAIASLISSTGPWPVIVPALIAIVGVALIALHNRRVARAR